MSATTPSMGLTQWTVGGDNFSHGQLAANFAAIDAHDHTGSPTKGVQVPTGGLANLAVTSGKIAADAVLTAKILNLNVTTPKLANQSVTAQKVGVLPRVRAYHSVAQTIPNNTNTILAFNGERWDTDTMHDLVTNNSRITSKTVGLYFIGACVDWAVNTTGTRQITFLVNGTTVIAKSRIGAYAVNNAQQILSTVYMLGVNDYVEVQVHQTSGAGLDISAFSAYSPEFYAAFLSN